MNLLFGRARVRRYVFAAVLAAGLIAVRALSAAPGFWQTATQADFLRGEVDQLSIDEHGRLTLGPELTKVHDAAAPFVWTMVAAADGAWFLGTGNDGKVLKRSQRPRLGVLRQHRNGGPRARSRAKWRLVCRHLP